MTILGKKGINLVFHLSDAHVCSRAASSLRSNIQIIIKYCRRPRSPYLNIPVRCLLSFQCVITQLGFDECYVSEADRAAAHLAQYDKNPPPVYKPAYVGLTGRLLAATGVGLSGHT